MDAMPIISTRKVILSPPGLILREGKGSLGDGVSLEIRGCEEHDGVFLDGGIGNEAILVNNSHFTPLPGRAR